MIRILILEDSRHTRDQLAKRLRGYPTRARVILCARITEAIREVRLDAFGVAVLDMQLPDGCGLDLVPWLGEALVVVATAAPEDVPKGLRVVRKGPLWIAEIEAIVAAWKASVGKQ